MAGVSGIGIASVATGALFVYAGITGRNIPAALQAVISGKSPATVTPTQQITTASFTSSGPAGSSGSAGDVSAGASEQSFFTAFLKDIGAPVTDANLQAMYRWAAKEEPSWPPQASGISWTWNPLNITSSSGIPGPAGLSFASYPTPQAGAFGTAAFLMGNSYHAIVSSLRTGNGIADSPDVAAELSAWSGGGYTSVNSGGG